MNSTDLTLFENIEANPFSYSSIILNKTRFIQELNDLDSIIDIKLLRNRVLPIQNTIIHPKGDLIL